MNPSISNAVWRHERQGYRFQWDLNADQAELRRVAGDALVWSGSLLPLFWVQLPGGHKQCVQATVTRVEAAVDSASTVYLQLGDLGSGTLEITTDIQRQGAEEVAGVRFRKLSVEWRTAVAIIDLHFGAAPLTDPQRQIAPTLDLPFWPTWQAEGFCIPSAKGSPIQSFFRCWDFGHATIPLGSFGPAMGTPYAAAYPRPLLAAAMGGENGWVAIGPGGIPDAAFSLQIQASCAMLHWRYREDLHGAGPATRQWIEPLRLCWADTAWNAYARFFAGFDAPPARHTKSFSNINSWGSFKTGDFDLRRLTDRAVGLGAELMVIDDFWERIGGIGEPDLKRFPAFEADLAYARSQGLGIGFWQSVGWIDDPAAAGLNDADLLCGIDGKPRLANWAMNPHQRGRAHYCLDPASERTRAFLTERTRRIMQRYAPALLKLDFGYGLPGPDAAVSRNPEFRGERLACELLRLVSNAARSVDPKVRIQYYGIHPLLREMTDIIALDDLGDAGNAEAAGHGQWSVWAALASGSGLSLMASSGYEWEVDTEILLNTAIVGAPGCVLPMDQAAHPTFTPSRMLRRRAVSRWFRRTTRWEPLWLDTTTGSLHQEPTPRCWGRLESFDGRPQLTALVLRNTALRHAPPATLPVSGWEGQWALLAQDDRAIGSSAQLACIPFEPGHLVLELDTPPAKVIAVTATGERPATEAVVQGNQVRIDVTADRLEDLLGYLLVR